MSKHVSSVIVLAMVVAGGYGVYAARSQAERRAAESPSSDESSTAEISAKDWRVEIVDKNKKPIKPSLIGPKPAAGYVCNAKSGKTSNGKPIARTGSTAASGSGSRRKPGG